MSGQKPELRVIPSIERGRGVINRLQKALKLARAGKISSVAIAWVNDDGSADWLYSEAPNHSTMLGVIERMKHDMLRSTDE